MDDIELFSEALCEWCGQAMVVTSDEAGGPQRGEQATDGSLVHPACLALWEARLAVQGDLTPS